MKYKTIQEVSGWTILYIVNVSTENDQTDRDESPQTQRITKSSILKENSATRRKRKTDRPTWKENPKKTKGREKLTIAKNVSDKWYIRPK